LEFVENPQLCVKSDNTDAKATKEPTAPPTNEFDVFGIGDDDDDDDDDDDFNDFMDAGDGKPTAAPTNTVASTVLDELLLTPDPTPADSRNGTTDVASAHTSNVMDDFDDFFGEQTNGTRSE